MRRLIGGCVLMVILSQSANTTYAQHVKAPSAAEVFCRRLVKAKTIACTVQTYMLFSAATHEMSANLNPCQRYEVKAVRPNCLSEVGTPGYDWPSVGKAGNAQFTMAGNSLNVFRANAKGRIQIDTTRRYYVVGPALKSLSDYPKGSNDAIYAGLIFDKYPLIDPSESPAISFEPVPDETLHGITVAVYMERTVDHTGQWKLYFDKRTGELQQLSIFNTGRDGTLVEDDRVEYSHWQFDVKFPASTFDTTPPPGIESFEETMKRLKRKRAERQGKQPLGALR